jgi:uncharacterized protein YjbI with pentapeptide repeats
MKMKIYSVFGKLLFEGDFADIKECFLAALKSRADLRDADLSDADLRGADLSGSNLSGANLSDADLSDADLRGANLSGSNLSGADLRDADLSDANLRGANLSGASLRGANLRGSNLSGADLSGASLSGASLSDAHLNGELKAKKMRVFNGLYKYQVWAVLAQDGTRYVRMGCLFYSLGDWGKIGIRKSNESEFPDDGSEKCEERVAAFEFAKAAAMRLK